MVCLSDVAGWGSFDILCEIFYVALSALILSLSVLFRIKLSCLSGRLFRVELDRCIFLLRMLKLLHLDQEK